MRRKKGLSFYHKKKRVNTSIFREVISFGFIIIIAIILGGTTEWFLGMKTNVVGSAMDPTLYNGQEIYIDRIIYTFSKPQVGDVVVFLPNGNEKAHYYVKRVVAGAGDKLKVIGGKLYVNGIESAYVTEEIKDPGIAENEIVLGNGEIFCMGDQPSNSEDSRSPNIGPVKTTDVIGKAWLKKGKKKFDYHLIK